MDPKPPSEETPVNQSPLPENKKNEYEDIKESKTLKTFRTKVLEFARESRMSPDHILLIEQSFPDFFPDLHVPDHPPYAAMIHRAITELDEARGSTEEAISLFIKTEHNDLPWAHVTLLSHHLQKLCENGDVVVTGDKCYMLNTSCVTYNHNQIENFYPNQIVAFNPNPNRASPIPSPYSSPSSSSSHSSHSDYTLDAKKRKQRRTGRKYGNKRRCDRKKRESEEEFEINEEEHSEETEEEEESEEYEEEFEELYNTEEEEEVEETEVENRLIIYKGRHAHRTEGAKKNKTKKNSEFRDEHMRVVPVKNQVISMYNRGTNLVRGRGRPPKCSKPKTYIGPKEAQVEPSETHNQVAEVAKRLKQKRGRGRPPKNIGLETETRPKETQQLLETHNQVREVLNGPKQSRKRSSPPKEIGTDTNIGPIEVHKEVTRAFTQATEDLKRPREKRGRGRPPKNSRNETNIGQKEAQREVVDAHNQMDSLEKPKQKRGRGRPPKNSEGHMVVFEVHNRTTEDSMKVKHRRRLFRRKHERKEVNKYLDQLELTVLQDMFERMKIRSCDDGENVYGAVSPSFPCKSCEPVMEDKIKKVGEQQIQSSVRGVELIYKHEGTDDETYPCQLHLQACRSEARSGTDENAAMKEMAPSQGHEEQQPECIGQDGPPGFEHVTTIVQTTIAPITVSNYQPEDVRQQQITKEESSTFMELLHSEYQYIVNDKQLDQPKKQSCGVSGKPTYCTGEDDKNTDCDK